MRRAHGSGSIFQRPDGKWQGQITFGVDLTGKRVRRTVTGATRKEVQARLDEMRSEGPRPERTRLVAQAVFDRLAVLKSQADAGKIKPSTLEYWQHMARHLAPLGKRRLAALKPADIVEWQKGLDLAPSTKRGAFLFARSALPAHAFEGLHAPVARPQREVVAADAEDVAALVAALEDPWRAIVEVLSVTGLRVGEVLALRWSDVGDGTVTVRTGKTDRARRTVPLLPAGAAAIERQPKDGPLIFPHDRRTVARKVEAARPRPGLTPHSLRHGLATRLLSQGVPMVVVSRILGHASISTTVDAYGHTSTEVEAEAMRRALG